MAAMMKRREKEVLAQNTAKLKNLANVAGNNRSTMEISDNKEMYPYSYIFDGQKIILIWQTCNDKDIFKLDSCGRLISANDNKVLKEWLGDEQYKVHWDEGAEINFDKFWTALKNLRVGKSSSPKTCKILLDGWNFIEDLLRTFGLTTEMQRLRSPLLNSVYKKFFHGTNLPPVTPTNKVYSPLWKQDEISELRKETRRIWNYLCESSHIKSKQQTLK